MVPNDVLVCQVYEIGAWLPTRGGSDFDDFHVFVDELHPILSLRRNASGTLQRE
jgi:hypothetical protein